jgi:5-methylcytosine-specific restriction enzyme subunit McrC
MSSLTGYTPKIPIKNIYYMLCYAWNRLEEKDYADVAREDEKDIYHLLTRILIVKLRSLIKRGFYREYCVNQEEASTIRGRILFQESIKTFSFKRGRLHTEFDEMSHNILHNQLIKTTLYNLLHQPNLDIELKESVHQLMTYFNGIERIPLNQRAFNQVRLHRSNLHYGFVLDICRFLYESLFLHEQGEGNKFIDFERDEKAMAYLFENFVRQFYIEELPGFKVKRDNIYWQAEGEHLDYLPMMQTDISLENDQLKIIMDTKYYQNAYTERYGGKKLISSNLYQLLAYLSNYKITAKQLSGILLYPKVDQDLNLFYSIQDYPVKVCTVDLNKNWRFIHERLLEVVRF